MVRGKDLGGAGRGWPRFAACTRQQTLIVASEPWTEPAFSHGSPRAEKAGAQEGSERKDAEEASFNARESMGLPLGFVLLHRSDSLWQGAWGLETQRRSILGKPGPCFWGDRLCPYKMRETLATEFCPLRSPQFFLEFLLFRRFSTIYTSNPDQTNLFS